MSTYLAPVIPYLASILAAGGGGGLIAWLIIKSFSDRWLESKFSENLESFKHAKNEELEKLRFEIAALMDRTVKLHQREFEVLPEAWGLLTDTFSILQPVVLGAQISPQLESMGQQQLENFLEKTSLEEYQKEELRNADSKSQYYMDAMERHNLRRAFKAYEDLHFYITKHGIFMPSSIKVKFSEFDDLFFGALLERRHSLNHQKGFERFEKGLALQGKGRGLLKSLEDEVQGRLWSGVQTGKL